MNEVRLRKIILKNYMNIASGEWDFCDRTMICGKNAVGKTTLMNAYFDVLTGKLANGSAPTNICPLDETGAEIPVKEIERTVVLEINGEEHAISKITKRKYRKDVFVGTETSYKLDDSPAKAAEVNEFISWIAPVDVVAMCSNASVFMNTMKKSTAEARKHVEKLSGFDLGAFCNSVEEYKRAFEMTKGRPVEDVVKALKKSLKAENGDLDKLNIELGYERRNLDRMDGSNLEKLQSEKLALEKQIIAMQNLKESLDESVNYYTFLLGQADKIRRQMIEIEDRQTASDRKDIRKLNEEANGIRAEIEKQTRELSKMEAENRDLWLVISMKKSEYSHLVDELEKHEKLSFSDDGICPTCGQKILKEQMDKRRAEFEKSRTGYIQTLKEKIAELNAEIEYSEANFKGKEEKINFYKAEIEKKTEKEAEVRKMVDKRYNAIAPFAKTDEFLQLEEQLKHTEALADEISNSGELRSNVLAEISKLKIELARKEAEINGVIKETESSEQKILELTKRVKEQAQLAADIERNICLLQEFSIAKNKAIEDLVNSKFEFINLKMSEETLDGTIKETLKIQVNGVDYFAGLNHGDRILTEIYLLKGLQDMNEIKLPIWVDDTESVDDWRIPDIERQEILIRRTDASKLSVKGMEE